MPKTSFKKEKYESTNNTKRMMKKEIKKNTKQWSFDIIPL